MKKVPTAPNLALECLEIVSAPKQKLYIRNQKELKHLFTKNPEYGPFRYKVDKTHFHYFNFISFFLEKKEKVILHFAVAFQRCQIY